MGPKILLADDSTTMQKVIELTFTDEDFELHTVGNGQKAIEEIRTVKPDIVLCDIIMPEKSGYEVCEHIKTSDDLKHIPVLLLTGAFEPFDQDRAKKAGSNGFLAKPFEPQTLISKVKELLSTPTLAASDEIASSELAPAQLAQDPPTVTPGVTDQAGSGMMDEPVPSAPPVPVAPTPSSPTPTFTPDPIPLAPPVEASPPAQIAPAEPVKDMDDLADKIAKKVLSQLSEKVIQEIAWEVVPDLAEALIQKEIAEIKAKIPK